MSRGQAALEFLSTYGFAFFILLVTLGALSYAGIFNVASLRGSECSFPQGAGCQDYIMNTANGGGSGAVPALPNSNLPYVRTVLYNTYGVNLTVTAAQLQMQQFQGAQSCSYAPAGSWSLNTNLTLWCPVPAAAYHPTQRYDGAITLNFTQAGGNYNHTIKGTISVIAQ